MLSKNVAETKNKADRQLLVSVIVIACILIVLFWVIFNSYRKSKLSEIERNIEFAQQLQDSLEKKEKDFIEANHSIKKLIESNYDILDKVSSLIYEGKENAVTRKKVSDLVTNLIEDITNNPKKKQELIDLVNSNFSGIYTQFCTDFPDLKDKDYDLFLFSTLGFSSNAIALFLKVEKVSSVYNMRRHLKDKIKASTSGEGDKYLKFI